LKPLVSAWRATCKVAGPTALLRPRYQQAVDHFFCVLWGEVVGYELLNARNLGESLSF
jgi:hypothetical protein